MISKKNVMKKICSVIMAAAMGLMVAAVPSTDAHALYGINELTGLPTAANEMQRPVAVMIDNDQIASPHYGLAEADIVYELVNSTRNNRVTRLMAIYKDYASVPRIGNIRSARPTNIMLANEYDAVLVHDGGPVYINPFITFYNLPHLSGGFARIPNGKPSWYTEYATTGQIGGRIAGAGYTPFYQNVTCAQNRFNFGTNTLPAGVPVGTVSLPFIHNATKLIYNGATGTYDLFENGKYVKDGDDFQQVTFKNCIIQCAPMMQYDANGYMVYGIVGTGVGYYLTCGKAVAIMWFKDTVGHTIYMNMDGTPLTVNPGKTYIGIVPDDSWAFVTFA